MDGSSLSFRSSWADRSAGSNGPQTTSLKFEAMCRRNSSTSDAGSGIPRLRFGLGCRNEKTYVVGAGGRLGGPRLRFGVVWEKGRI
jgi:hypothetical protein